ncbi:hypothetical protein E1B28_012767 [Marasmius oreades]|uniref:Uncharacterized protein n=1 Tax=Marasmius oreades TaxID=181124 RepID=A0A9P7RSS9_9AGAR|nr:uncharacterized protein E1B28_012767 [Marasmius oreades]KAG7088807.1 hypothetical protein E1B28_012767 [Marasmius oreades]
MALQLLSRKRYPESVLDLYVEHRYSSFLGSFLEAIGYKFKPTQVQPKRLNAALQHIEGLRAFVGDVPGIGVSGAFNLNMARGDRKIQLITADDSSLDIILKFHSTVVMNVISYSHIYSLYPRGTFQESLSLINHWNDDSEQQVARQKYVDRGWKMLDSDGSEWKLNSFMVGFASFSSYSESYHGLTEEHIGIFQVNKLRRLGDSYCWTFKLPTLVYPTENDPSTEQGYRWLMSRRYDLPTPLVMEELLTGKQALESNTWVLSLQEYEMEDEDGEMFSTGVETYRMRFYNDLSNSQLRFTYCVGMESEDHAAHELIKRVHASEVVRGRKGTEGGPFGGCAFSAPLDFRAKSIDLLLYDVVDEHLRYLDEEK